LIKEFPMRLLSAMLVVLALAACGQGFGPDNCASPIAAADTEQCNPYLSRTP
jgi:hypothetical protein